METMSAFDHEWTMQGDELPFRKSLFSTACRMTGDPETAEDLLQETYLKAFRFYGQFRRGTNFRAWLFKILKNSFINYYRKKTFETSWIRRTEADLEAMPAGPDFPDSGFSMDEFSMEIDDEIREAMASIPEVYRSMVILRDLNQYSYKEIARLTGVPAGTVMSRLYRGRKMLEKALMSFGRRQGYLRARSVAKQRDKSLRAS